MQEFKLCDVVPKQEALEKGWRVLKFLGLTRRCSYVVKDFRALQPWRRDLFTPNSLPITNRIVDALAQSHGWARLVADATNAFFHAAEDEDICGECPPEFKDQLAAEGKETDVLFQVCQESVRTSGLSPRFCDFVNGGMCQKNLISCEALPCFFWHENLHILVELHQDDFYCTAPAESLMWLKEELKDEIRLKFSEIVCPSMRYSHLKASRLVTSQGTLIVASSRNITDVVQKCSGAPTPITLVRCGNPEADGQLLEAEEHRIFRRVVGIAWFLRTLRPDIAFAVQEPSHRLAAPRDRDFERCKRLCRNLSKTRGLGMFFPRGRGEDPDGFSIGSLQ